MKPVMPMTEPLSVSERSQLGDDGVARFDELLGIVRHGLQTLDDKPEETPETALRALWLLASGKAVSARAAGELPICSLSQAQDLLLRDLLEQRLRGTPLAHLTGRQHFMGIEMLAGPQALIPRRETELLGLAAVSVLKQVAAMRGTAVALDVCTGSGNLAIGLACAVPSAQILAADLSPDAVNLARRNVEFLGLESRVEVRQGDLLAPFDGPEFRNMIDVLVCNPPYISSGKVASMPPEIAEHEPALAFDGGPFGVRIIQRLMQDAPRILRQGGWLAFEVGLGQGPSVTRRMASSKCYEDIRGLNDEHGDTRAIIGRLAASAGGSSNLQ